jgi:hypothetical protein
VSPVERPVPPAGEEIHLPPGSIQPMLLALFISFALVLVTTFWPLSIAFAVAALWVIYAWIRDARREYSDLPAHPDQH